MDVDTTIAPVLGSRERIATVIGNTYTIAADIDSSDHVHGTVKDSRAVEARGRRSVRVDTWT